MYYVKYILLLQIIDAKLQLNLYFTDVMNTHYENASVVHQHCLYAGTNQPLEILDRHKAHFSLVAYCLSEPLSKFNIHNIEFFTNFTFVQLAQMNVTSDELYLWSAPIDLIENYQYYLNENDLSLSTNIFYNCTWPRFGSQCQYELDNLYRSDSEDSSLKEYINNYHRNAHWIQTNWTCYIHLNCIRTVGMRCLDWTDICDGKVDCLNNGIDEEHCWQLEIHMCQDNEYRCYDGLCIPKYFLRAEHTFSSRNCLHTNHKNSLYSRLKEQCLQYPNDFECHDSACSNTYLSSSCFLTPSDLSTLLYFEATTHVPIDCWSTFLCLFKIFQNCSTKDSNELYLIIERICPTMVFIPSNPILSGDIYITYIKNQSNDFYLCTNNSQYESYFVNHSKIIMNGFLCYEIIHWQQSKYRITNLFYYAYGSVHRYNRFFNYSSNICQRANMYQCLQSTKCISIYRIFDDISDCPYSDDENINLLQNQDKQRTHFYCSHSNKYIPHWKLENGACDCDTIDKLYCENHEHYFVKTIKDVSSLELCNGIIEYLPIIINGQIINDETYCLNTPCYHPDYRCKRPKYCVISNDEKQACQMNNRVRRQSSLELLPRCYFGITLHVWLDSKKQLSTITCLCPSNYYGDQCQYQNQRIIFRVAFDTSYNEFNTFFLIGISLIDDSYERIIHSHEQTTEMRTDDCRFESSLNLFYSTRPKDDNKSYFIHVDIYERVSLKYRASYLFPIDFPFLPVNLISKVIVIPRNNIKIKYCSNRQCNYHGKCIFYWNNSIDSTFCQCDRGWSGKYCTIEHECMCSSDSIYIGVSAQNRSICLCPIDRLGPRCLIHDQTCSLNKTSCQNGAQCLPNHDISISKEFFCICPQGFHGDYCENSNYQFSFSFEKHFIIPSSIYIYGFKFKYIRVQLASQEQLVRSIRYKRLSKKQTYIHISWKYLHDLIFIENIANKHYYLIQNYENANENENENISKNLTKVITSSDRCLHISEISNISISNLRTFERLKYYHILCQITAINISCFQEDTYLCICKTGSDTYKTRYAICLRYGKEFTNQCPDDSHCHFNGQCFHYNLQSGFYYEGPGCLKSMWCVCNRCYYGTQCEFSTSGFSLSIDSILGYHIETQTELSDQSLIVQISLALTILYLIIGSINSLFSFITFKSRITHEVGCGLYLLCSSVVTFILTILFALKMFVLIFTQIYAVENNIFLQIQCHSLDFLLRSCLYMDRWLSTSVSVERAVCAIQGIRFNKTKGKQIAKFIIGFQLIFILTTNIHDPIYRKLIDNNNEMDDEHVKRIWCISDYSSSSILLIYNNIIHTFHFFIPFICEIMASIILIAKKSRFEANAHKNRQFKHHLLQQFQTYKHLLLASLVLVILAIPNLSITYMSKCMESIDDAWIYLIAYFISFVPPMLTFVIFVLPSKFYKGEFIRSMRNILRRLHFIS